jgi:hypothetical protein
MLSVLIAAAVAASTPSTNTDQALTPVNCTDPLLNDNAGTLLHLRLREETQVDGAEPQAVVIGSALAAAPAPQGYVRLVIRYTPCRSNPERNYRKEERVWIKRMFAHKVVSKILKVTASVKPLGVTSTHALSSIGRDSGKTGEVFTTAVDNDGILLPYFRVEPDTFVDLNFDFSSTRDYTTSIAGDALDIIHRAAVLISPTSTLITSENKGRFNDAANFVDSTINGLLKVAISESAHVGVQLNGNAQKLATITLYVPGADDPYPSTRIPDHYVGQWQIFAEPLPQSVFARIRRGGTQIQSDLSAASIMNFTVNDGKSLKEALTGQSSVQSARDALLNAKSNEVADAAIALCRAVARETDALGFSSGDVGYAVWAYFNDLALPQAKATALNSCEGMDHFAVVAVDKAAAPTATDSNSSKVKKKRKG